MLVSFIASRLYGLSIAAITLIETSPPSLLPSNVSISSRVKLVLSLNESVLLSEPLLTLTRYESGFKLFPAMSAASSVQVI